MTDISQLVPSKRVVPSPQQTPARGVVSTPPVGLTDLTMRVVIPGHSSDYDMECRWIRQGNALPAALADCLVVFDETGAGTVVWWSAAIIDMATQAELDAAVAVEALHYVGTAGQPAFQNSWANFDAGTPGVTAGMRAAAFYTHDGRVYLQGVIKTGASGAVAFTLPVGYRPAGSDAAFVVASSGGVTTLRIENNGLVTPIGIAASDPSTYCFLDGANFRHA